MKSLKELYKIGNGPSSSHTMGPKNACLIFTKRYPNCNNYKVYLYGSLALTGKGHLTDYIIKKTLKNVEVIFDLKTEVTFPNTMRIDGYHNNEFIASLSFNSVGGGIVNILGEKQDKALDIYNEKSFKEVINYLKENNIDLSLYVDRHEDIDEYLKEVIKTFENCLENGLNNKNNLPGKLNLTRKAKLILDSEINNILFTNDEKMLIAYAYAIAEENASGGVVVTTPTCGSAGVLPSVLLYMRKLYKTNLETEIKGLKVAGVIGNIIKQNASISGAYAGCQAEIGVACAMASSYVMSLFTNDIYKIERAAEIALEHHLGLTCDPVGGYVQIPCIERNAVGALRALESVKLALVLETKEAKISFDTIAKTMLETGVSLPRELKETSIGGLAKEYDINGKNK